ncbi:MAG: diadenylate cyclase CdaA [Thermoanaerobaculia bacterium]
MNVFERVISVPFTFRDAADVVLVALIIYGILKLIRGTRAMQISIGLMVLASTFFVARAFQLIALEAVSREILFYLPFAIIVLFQQEIRRALARMGGNPFLAMFRRHNGGVPFDEILDACDHLASKSIGALIAIEGAQTLRTYEEMARPLDALVSADLIVAIFTPGGPLHDGAVLIRGNRAIAAGAFLPLTTAADPTLGHGTRHRAALGLSEESDAFLIVMSEENGSIAAASEGKLHQNLDRRTLGQLLGERFGEQA